MYETLLHIVRKTSSYSPIRSKAFTHRYKLVGQPQEGRGEGSRLRPSVTDNLGIETKLGVSETTATSDDASHPKAVYPASGSY